MPRSDERQKEEGISYFEFARNPLGRNQKDKYEGLSVKQIAEREGKHLLDAMLDLTVADELKTEWQTPSLNENAELATMERFAAEVMPALREL